MHSKNICSCNFCKIVKRYNLSLQEEIPYNYEEYEDEINKYNDLKQLIDSLCLVFIDNLSNIYDILNKSGVCNNSKLNYILSKVKEIHLYVYSTLEIVIGRMVEFKESSNRNKSKLMRYAEMLKGDSKEKNQLVEIVSEFDTGFRKDRNEFSHKIINFGGECCQYNSFFIIYYINDLLRIYECIKLTISLSTDEQSSSTVLKNILIRKENYYCVIEYIIEKLIAIVEMNLCKYLNEKCRETVNAIFSSKYLLDKLEERKKSKIIDNTIILNNKLESIFDEEEKEFMEIVLSALKCKKKDDLSILLEKYKYDKKRLKEDTYNDDKSKTIYKLDIFEIYKNNKIYNEKEDNKYFKEDNKYFRVLNNYLLNRKELVEQKKFWDKVDTYVRNILNYHINKNIADEEFKGLVNEYQYIISFYACYNLDYHVGDTNLSTVYICEEEGKITIV